MPSIPGEDRCAVVLPKAADLTLLSTVTSIHEADVIHTVSFDLVIDAGGERLAIYRLRELP